MAEPKPTRKNSSQVESSPTFEESLSQLEASVRVLEGR
jgi:exonuclease VII small subunit